MNKFPFFKSFLFLLAVAFFISCDKDYNDIGANIIGSNNFEFEKDNFSTVKCYNQFDAVVQSNNLPINTLGVYNDADFGKTVSSFVTQLELAAVSPDIPNTAIIKEVILTVPYYSRLTDGSSDTYELDSIHGVISNKIKLSVYETSKYLETYDGETLLGKRYYSNQFDDFNNAIIGTRLNDSDDTSQNDAFIFNAAQQTEFTLASDGTTQLEDDGTEKTTTVTPRMKLNLNTAFFQNKLIGETASPKLETNAIFKEYFRSLFFKVEQFDSENVMAQLDFSKGKIVVYYKEAETETTRKTITLNLVRNTLNLFQNQFNSDLITNETPEDATTTLFLKGGAGYHSYIDLFGTAIDGVVPDENPEVIAIKAKKWIINEANLIFTASSATSFEDNPNRVYLYDAKNKRTLIDYSFDSYVNSSKPKYNKLTHSGIKYLEDGLTKYKIRITNHIKNIINKDSTNVRLGLVITEDINNVSNMYLKNVASDKYYNRVPQSSVINPLGLMLWGSDSSVEDSKRLKLEIYYTKPN